PLIQSLALRLVAGQFPDGGWSYPLPVLDPAEEKKFLAALQATRPARPADLFVKGADGRPRLDLGVVGFDDRSKPSATRPGRTLPYPARPGDEAPRPAATPEEIKKALRDLPKKLRNVPALQPGDPNRNGPHFLGVRPDNSNTQFAVLGLWAASRHGL